MNKHTRLSIIAISIVIPLSSLAVYGTDSNQQALPKETSKLQVISSFYPLHEFSQNIGGDKANTRLIIPVGIEPHDWEPTIKDVQTMQNSDLIVINGIGFENWVEKIDSNNFSGKIIDTSTGILIRNSATEHNEKHIEHTHNSGDPHIWLNPVYAKIQVQTIADAFSDSDPDNEDYYQKNAVTYIQQLDELNFKIRNELSSCNKDFVAFHNAFSYFSEEYGLNQHTIISSNDPHGEVTAKTLERIISLAREQNIHIIFSEENVDIRTSETIANEINGKVLVLSPLEVDSGGTYISSMTENLENLKEALC